MNVRKAVLLRGGPHLAGVKAVLPGVVTLQPSLLTVRPNPALLPGNRCGPPQRATAPSSTLGTLAGRCPTQCFSNLLDLEPFLTDRC